MQQPLLQVQGSFPTQIKHKLPVAIIVLQPRAGFLSSAGGSPRTFRWTNENPQGSGVEQANVEPEEMVIDAGACLQPHCKAVAERLKGQGRDHYSVSRLRPSSRIGPDRHPSGTDPNEF